MTSLKALGGTSDLLPGEVERWQQLEAHARELFHLYGYQEIRTPLIEEAAVFTRSLGEATEVVTKQMYLFEDRGGRQVVLRPEATASVVRAFIEHGLDKTAGLSRFYYIGPMFRAERPQAGRRRQFHQIGVEVFGSPSPYQDAEVMVLLMRLLENSGLKIAQSLGEEGAVLKVNNLGCHENGDRQKMTEGLKKYFRENHPNLCKDCQRKIEINPLRILDCKKGQCHSISSGSMQWDEWLCKDCKEYFKLVLDALGYLGILYKQDRHLVRGLDYYTRTAFEVIAPGLGAQNAVGGGGRYDNLVESLGGQPTPAVGFAVGVERLLMAAEAAGSLATEKETPLKVFIATVTSAQIPAGLKLAELLRGEGISTSVNLEDRPLNRQMGLASKLVPSGYVLILGEDEVKEGLVTRKEMSTGRQDKISQADLIEQLKRR